MQERSTLTLFRRPLSTVLTASLGVFYLFKNKKMSPGGWDISPQRRALW